MTVCRAAGFPTSSPQPATLSSHEPEHGPPHTDPLTHSQNTAFFYRRDGNVGGDGESCTVVLTSYTPENASRWLPRRSSSIERVREDVSEDKFGGF